MIEVQNLYKSFADKVVLQDISLKIEQGETFAIIGRSGSGKSVLLKHLIGLMKPNQGRVLIDGTDINAVPYEELREVRRKFGVLFQGGAMFDSMSAAENVAFPLKMFTKRTKAEINDRVAECLNLVELPDAGNKRISDLSGGMRKRVALARAIALEPAYVFYDEPNSGLDPQTANTIDALIKNLADKVNITSIVITHDMHSVLSIADRAAFIFKGRLHWIGSMEDLHRSTDKDLLDFVKANEYKIGV